MKSTVTVCDLFSFACSLAAFAAPHSLLKDDFDRSESDDALEEVGNGWETNSKKRAKGVKQADLKDGALFMKRADVADHGVSVTHAVAFRNAEIRLRFKLDHAKDQLGINIADLNEKTVHAGHICMASIRGHNVELVDLKTGKMDLKARNARENGKISPEEKKRLKTKAKVFPRKLDLGKWHALVVKVEGETMTVSIDGEEVGSFTSEGIGHPTKSRLRLAVAREAWVDDLEIVGE